MARRSRPCPFGLTRHRPKSTRGLTTARRGPSDAGLHAEVARRYASFAAEVFNLSRISIAQRGGHNKHLLHERQHWTVGHNLCKGELLPEQRARDLFTLCLCRHPRRSHQRSYSPSLLATQLSPPEAGYMSCPLEFPHITTDLECHRPDVRLPIAYGEPVPRVVSVSATGISHKIRRSTSPSFHPTPSSD